MVVLLPYSRKSVEKREENRTDALKEQIIAQRDL
jgi:hypothetical protein